MRHRTLATINSVKHFIAKTNGDLAANTTDSFPVADAVAISSGFTNTYDVREGSVIKAIHIELWIVGNGATGTSTQFIVTVQKYPSGTIDITNAQALNLQAYPNKKNILYTTQGNSGSVKDGTNSVPVIREWIAIPKGKQRMGFGDRIQVDVSTIGQTLLVCGMFIYKEYY